jgi:flagellar motor switch protein FliG
MLTEEAASKPIPAQEIKVEVPPEAIRIEWPAPAAAAAAPSRWWVGWILLAVVLAFLGVALLLRSLRPPPAGAGLRAGPGELEPLALEGWRPQPQGDQRAEEETIEEEELVKRPFSFIRPEEETPLGLVLEAEPPEVIATVLAYLPPARAARLLEGLPTDVQGAVGQHIVALSLGRSTQDLEAVQQLEERIREQLSVATGGPGTLAQILNLVGRGTETAVLEALHQADPQTAMQVRNSMFIFEDLVHSDPSAIQILATHPEVRPHLPLALKTASSQVQQTFFQALSERGRAMLRDDLETLPAVSTRQSEEAQRRILSVARALEAQGRLSLER